MNKVVAIRVWVRDECSECKGAGFIPIANEYGEVYEYCCDNDRCKDGYIETAKKLEISEFARMVKNTDE